MIYSGWTRFQEGFPVPVYRPYFKREENAEGACLTYIEKITE